MSSWLLSVGLRVLARPGLVKLGSRLPHPLIRLLLRLVRPREAPLIASCFAWPRSMVEVESTTMGAWMKACYQAVSTPRFVVVLDPIDPMELGIRAKSEEELESEAKSWCREFLEGLGNKSVGEVIKYIDERVKVLELKKPIAHELIHEYIISGTTFKLLLEISSWGERFFLMHIAEMAHRELDIPRSPEKEWRGGLRDPAGYVKGLGDELKQLSKEVLKPLRNLIKSLFFQVYYVKALAMIGVEIPTWVIMLKSGLIKEREYYKMLDEYLPYYNEEKVESILKALRELEFRGLVISDDELREQLMLDNKLRKLAEDLGRRLKGFTDFEGIVKAARKLISPPLKELAEVQERGLEGVLKMLRNRFYRIDEVEEAEVEIPSILTILRCLPSSFEGLEETVKLMLEILSEEDPGVVNLMLSQAGKPYPGFGMVLRFKFNGKLKQVLYDPWTMEEQEWIGKVISIRTGRPISTLEDIVGSTPRIIKGYILLSERLMGKVMEYKLQGEGVASEGVRERITKELLKELQLDIPKDLFTRYLIGLEGIDYKGLGSYKDLEVEDVVDILSGWIYTLASLGEHSIKLGGLHGRYLL